MTYTVYADVLFVLNFAVDFICMCASLYICRLKRRILPILLSSVAGGIYSVLSLYLESLSPVIRPFIHISALLLMCIISTPAGEMRTVLKVSALFFSISALCGGVVSSFISTMGRYSELGGSIYADVSPLTLFALLLITASMSVPFFIKTQKRLSYKTASVSIEHKENKKTFDALIDTGNLLSDPVSGDGIILVKHKELAGIFGEEQLLAIKSFNVLSESFPSGIRLIPWEKGLIPIFRPETVSIKLFGSKKRKEISAVIGIDFSQGSFGGASGLVPASYIN